MEEEKSLSLVKGVLQALTAVIHIKDPYTFEHCNEVEKLCGKFSSHMGINHQQVIQMEIAGHLHDVDIFRLYTLFKTNINQAIYRIANSVSTLLDNLLGEVQYV